MSAIDQFAAQMMRAVANVAEAAAADLRAAGIEPQNLDNASRIYRAAYGLAPINSSTEEA